MTAHSPHSGHRRRQNRTPLIAAAAAGVLAVTLAAQAALASGESGAAAAPAGARALAVPRTASEVRLTATRRVTGVLDGARTRFTGAGALGGDGRQAGRTPLFELADGAVLKNVVLGAPAAAGVRCLGSCTLENVYWEDVGEHAAAFLGRSADAVYTVSGGGAADAAGTVFRFDGAGTLTVRDFAVAGFGELVRSCGDCGEQFRRDVVLENVTATAPGRELVGVNGNFGDTARLSGVTVVGDPGRDIVPCQKFEGVTGGDPAKADAGPDQVNCLFEESDVTFR
ncbi:pectate lyase [Streptomyces sp. ID05-04B]|uniref:pectate lyase n=1 Tax=unclassified Streptomyces TaxID=2593676 RepID=UPI0020B1218E|nr:MULTISPECIES: pectate lyase [unclassified Streptomyces]MDX5567639.1 pectate lyase [Streptomyces sp. ID05-04B]